MATTVGSLLLGDDEGVLAFMRQRLPALDFGPCATMGVMRAGRMIGGIVFNNFKHPDVEISAAFDTANWGQPRTVRAIFAYPFLTLGCSRLTLVTPRQNTCARRFAEKAGFLAEGVKRAAAHDGSDLFIFGMLRSECRYLPKGA